MSSLERAESMDSFAMEVKKLHGNRASTAKEIHPEFLKALNVVGLSHLICLCNIAHWVQCVWLY